MRHRKHRFGLGVKKEHRQALMANLAAALFRHGRIETTLPKAKALRPFAERIITMAKKAQVHPDRALHMRRLAVARVRDAEAVRILFNERAGEFTNREGGYTRIYKMGLPRVGDAAEMAIITLVEAGDEGYRKPKKRAKKGAAKKAAAPVTEEARTEAGSDAAQEASTTEEPKAEAPEAVEESTQPEAEATDEAEKDKS